MFPLRVVESRAAVDSVGRSEEARMDVHGHSENGMTAKNSSCTESNILHIEDANVALASHVAKSSFRFQKFNKIFE